MKMVDYYCSIHHLGNWGSSDISQPTLSKSFRSLYITFLYALLLILVIITISDITLSFSTLSPPYLLFPVWGSIKGWLAANPLVLQLFWTILPVLTAMDIIELHSLDHNNHYIISTYSVLCATHLVDCFPVLLQYPSKLFPVNGTIS